MQTTLNESHGLGENDQNYIQITVILKKLYNTYRKTQMIPPKLILLQRWWELV